MELAAALYWLAQLKTLQIVQTNLMKKALEEEQRLVALSISEYVEAGKLLRFAEKVGRKGTGVGKMLVGGPK
jgi:hypothetical protein